MTTELSCIEKVYENKINCMALLDMKNKDKVITKNAPGIYGHMLMWIQSCVRDRKSEVYMKGVEVWSLIFHFFHGVHRLDGWWFEMSCLLTIAPMKIQHIFLQDLDDDLALMSFWDLVFGLKKCQAI